MVRQVQVTVPHALVDRVVSLLRARDHVHAVVTLRGDFNSMVVFKSIEKHVSDTLRELENLGVGIHHGVVDIIELKSTKPLISTFFDRQVRKKRKYKVTDRMAVEEIYESVDSQCHLTFDYLLFCFVAAMISGVGLIQDSSVTVVASMLVSPLMGPILGVTFGTVIRSGEMVWRAFRNEMWGILVCLLVGFVTGFVVGPFFGPCGIQTAWSATQLRSSQMESRGTIGGLVAGFAAAVPSGVGVALAITGGGINALVGVAISAALLPPVVNAGTCFALSLWYYSCELVSSVETDTYYHAESEKLHFAGVGAFSFALFVVNFVVIFMMALCLFKLKRVRPWVSRSRFWKERMHPDVSMTSGLLTSTTDVTGSMRQSSIARDTSERGDIDLAPSGRAPSFDTAIMATPVPSATGAQLSLVRSPVRSPMIASPRHNRQRSNTHGH